MHHPYPHPLPPTIPAGNPILPTPTPPTIPGTHSHPHYPHQARYQAPTPLLSAGTTTTPHTLTHLPLHPPEGSV
ncbi:hypothetical protein Pmani_009269 [Petrolisthes manimaculis]|uniref:Uncharacterized protein n=1 Tax=Petrolisthes manimaculis TaxID=1843537 RepID=A0AAE1UD21_9EUCA|nr:hypothetical protein Pmani_009269 [Petrolisthes manimaculis]